MPGVLKLLRHRQVTKLATGARLQVVIDGKAVRRGKRAPRGKRGEGMLEVMGTWRGKSFEPDQCIDGCLRTDWEMGPDEASGRSCRAGEGREAPEEEDLRRRRSSATDDPEASPQSRRQSRKATDGADRRTSRTSENSDGASIASGAASSIMPARRGTTRESIAVHRGTIAGGTLDIDRGDERRATGASAHRTIQRAGSAQSIGSASNASGAGDHTSHGAFDALSQRCERPPLSRGASPRRPALSVRRPFDEGSA